jgi:hypothetical protein
MDFGDVDAPFLKISAIRSTFRPLAMGFEDLSLVFSQGVHLRLLR